jgi:RimJ/RimL family protein N-acetyltransferase
MARVDVYDLSAMHALERHGFGYIETTITNTLDIKDMDATPSKDFTIRQVRPDETEQLVDFSIDAFKTHRFYTEKRFATEKVDEMYKQWVQSALKNPNIWTTIVLEKNEKVLGFMTYAIEDLREYFETRFVKLRMACLDQRERGKSHGVDLFNGVMQYTQREADVIVSGLTLRNIHSFNLHTKLNYKLKCSTNTLHKWFS